MREDMNRFLAPAERREDALCWDCYARPISLQEVSHLLQGKRQGRVPIEDRHCRFCQRIHGATILPRVAITFIDFSLMFIERSGVTE